MKIDENDRLDLRQALEALFEDERIAEIAMTAMPPIDYDRFATKQDVANMSIEVKADIARLDAKIETLAAKVDSKAAELLRVMVLANLTTTVMLAGYVTAVLG